MNDKATQPEAFLPVRTAADKLGIPANWLRSEAEAGRVPHLRIGRRLFVDPQAVRESLLSRSMAEARSC